MPWLYKNEEIPRAGYNDKRMKLNTIKQTMVKNMPYFNKTKHNLKAF